LGLDRTRWPELLVGLERVEVLEVARASGGQPHVAIETTDRLAGCPGCGCRARVSAFLLLAARFGLRGSGQCPAGHDRIFRVSDAREHHGYPHWPGVGSAAPGAGVL